MLNSVQLKTMLELQDKMNSKVNPAWLTAGYAYLRAAMIEAVEAIDHHGWKWWKHQKKDLPQLQMELVDIWHFALSELLITYQGDVEKCAQIIGEELKNNPNKLIFDNNEYVFIENGLLENLQLMAGLCAAKRFDVPLFMHIVLQAEMDTSELYRQYVGKNVLNFFRQDNGYKDGRYVKEWQGLEDNEHLVNIMENLDINAATYATQVYQHLQDAYPGSS